jgi:hypothetical protein
MSTNPLMRPDLQDPRLLSLYDYWAAKCGGRSMPTRADIDPLEMRSWLGNLVLIDVTADSRFVYRLYGSKFVDSFGLDMTGRSVDDLPPEQGERVRADYESVRATAKPRWRLYTASFEIPAAGGGRHQQVVTWERLVLPLSDGGVRVAMLLVGAYPLADLRPSTS